MQTMRFIAPFAAVLALSACGGGGGLGGVLGGLGGNTPQCDPGTTVQLANPAPNQFNVSPNIGQITVVANGNADTLYNTYPQWSVRLPASFGGPPIQGGPLHSSTAATSRIRSNPTSITLLPCLRCRKALRGTRHWSKTTAIRARPTPRNRLRPNG